MAVRPGAPPAGLDPLAIYGYTDAQKHLLRRTYDRSWQDGVEAYEPDTDPQHNPKQPYALAVKGVTGAAGAAALARTYKYQPPAGPDPVRRAVALAPGFTGINRMATELAQIQAGTSPALLAAKGDFTQALGQWADDNAWRLDSGVSVAWAGEQAGYAEAAAVDGYLFQWFTESDQRVCFPAGTNVTTSAGSCAIENVRVGDRVLTHRGRYSRVVALQRNEWTGSLWNVVAGGRRVRCTPGHPFLVNRQQELHWVRADSLAVGDSVASQKGDDFGGLAFGNTNDLISTAAQVGITAHVTGRVSMPVGSVDLDHESFTYQKVDRVGSDDDFLAVRDISAVECVSRNPFGDSFACVSPPAGAIAKDVGSYSCGTYPLALPASGAACVNRRTSALFRTVAPRSVMAYSKRLSAPLAVSVGSGRAATVGAPLDPIGGSLLSTERSAARDALFFHRAIEDPTLPRAASVLTSKLTAALWTFLSRRRIAWTSRAMGMESLPSRIALRIAEPLLRGRVREREASAALAALAYREPLWRSGTRQGTYARAVVARRLLAGSERLATSQANGVSHQPILSPTTVYNLTVEDDHSYVANGFVVHNCDGCLDLGSFPPMVLADWPTTPGSGATDCNVGCFSEETLVEGAFVAGLETFYAGQMVELQTASGARVALTPNHPVATTKGFVPAGQLRQGDYLFHRITGQRCGSVGASIPAKHNDYSPVAIQQVFNTLQEMSPLLRVEARGKDLHGDGGGITNGQIKVVATHGKLVRNMQASLAKHGREHLLKSAVALRTTLRAGPGQQFSVPNIPPSRGFPRSPKLSPNQLRVGLDSFPLQALRIGTPTQFNARLAKPAGESPPADSQFIAQLLKGATAEIVPDQLIKVHRVHEWRGHVYDLQSTTGWLLAGSLVCSNCRCSLQPVQDLIPNDLYIPELSAAQNDVISGLLSSQADALAVMASDAAYLD